MRRALYVRPLHGLPTRPCRVPAPLGHAGVCGDHQDRRRLPGAAARAAEAAMSAATNEDDMLRRILLILSVVGLMSSVGLWGLSVWHLCGYEGRKLHAGVNGGCLIVGWHDRIAHGGWLFGYRPRVCWWLPFVERSRSGSEVFIPLWMPALAFGSFLGLCIHRPSRRRLGLCHRCGYDLRGSPGACPECGHERR